MVQSSKRNIPYVTLWGLVVVLLGGCGNSGEKSGHGSSPGTTPQSPASAARPTMPTGAAAPASTPGAIPSVPAATPDIAGTYTIKGTNPGGGAPYTGGLVVTKRDKVLQFSWKSGTATYDGVGVQSENTVGVAFASGTEGKGCSVAHYKIEATGALSGRWGAWGANASGTETATRSGGPGALEGAYAVTGARLDGKAYKGNLSVSAQGAGFLFDWNTGDKSQGFGIKKGSYVSVGIGGGQCGFVSYEIKSDGTLDGQWSTFKSKAIGTEIATKTK